MSLSALMHALIKQSDNVLRTLFPPENRSLSRPNPAEPHQDNLLSPSEKKHVAGLMRVNHAGEVCAQALYQGQALTAKLADIEQQMRDAAQEEVDHLGWCEERLHELGSHPSILNPFWYAGSFVIGALAGYAGDKISLGFVAETEKQVTAHLQHHLEKIPASDVRTKAILEQMKQDEQHHAESAIEAGAWDLPLPIKELMSLVSKLMTKTSYHI